MNPKISVIVPVYNVEKYLRKCIDSILNQSFSDFELILINDGSTDSSGLICEVYNQKDTRVKVINKKNSGSSTSRNIGLSLASGKYICFIDSDDWIEKNMFIEMFELAEKYSSDITISGIIFDKINSLNEVIATTTNSYEFSIWNNEEKLRNNIIKLFPNALINSSCNKLYRADLLLKNEITFPNTNVGEDTSFNLEAIKVSKSIIVTNESYYHYMRYEAIKTLTNRFHESAFERYLEIHKKMNDLFITWGRMDKEIVKEIDKTMFSQYLATMLKIIKLDNKLYSYKYKKILLNKGLNNSQIIDTFSSYESNSYKEKILIYLIKNRMYLITSTLLRIISKK
ncbi:glycosyltransferase family 2 protein [Clostridium celatum]|uniref:glycosyltransferase family 2 protein n=1 Tax=Clostridium celatum TaxID=36834 RepID=UPI002902CE56|nr:glycosyltransferase family 2 protein [Clostridium celatum]MDU2265556.1 glycosyltransferase family 2 protein [Clostridium celatum]MDU6295412.1 glycosyltransferase family 2 protein [Clostridium celatum]